MDVPKTSAQVAATCRKAIHRAIAQRDLEALRTAMLDLYVDGPLGGDVMNVETFAPIVEGAIMAQIHASGTPVCNEMRNNLKHTHSKFGLSSADYVVIISQLDALPDEDPHSVDWCAETALHGRVKPFRHEKLFEKNSGV